VKREQSSALYDIGEKEKNRFFFSLVQDTHKEINWEFVQEGFWVLQLQRVEVFKEHFTTLLVSLGSSFLW
jgi:hypothetical protein